MNHDAEQAGFAAPADPTRRSVLRAVAAGERRWRPNSRRSCRSATTVAKRLAQLERAHLVDARRARRGTRFEATPAPLGDAIAWMTQVGARCDARLAALARW